MEDILIKETHTPSLKIPNFIRITFKTLNFISSKIALLFASKLFTTPISFKTPDRELAMYNSSQKKTINIPKINKDIFILSYGYSDKKVLLAHGWSGRCSQLFMIANKLLEKGYMVISFDGPAHGNSKGKTTNLMEYIETIRFINSEYGPFEAAVGHSFGGIAIANTQAENNSFKCLVTIGSADKISDILFNFSKNLGLSKKFGSKLINYFEKKWKIKLDDFSTSSAMKKNQCPTLIVHDILDGDVSVSCAFNIRKTSNKGQLLISNGLGHTKILRDKTTTNRIVNYIKQNT